MCNDNDKTTMISSVVRSLAIAAIFLPVTLGVTSSIGRLTDKAEDTTSKTAQLEETRAALTTDCFAWMMSKKDTKVERDAESAIDEYFGGSVGYKEVCDWVLN